MQEFIFYRCRANNAYDTMISRTIVLLQVGTCIPHIHTYLWVDTYIFPLDYEGTQHPEDVNKLHKGERRKEPQWLPLVTELALDHGARRHVDISHCPTGQQDLIQHTGRMPRDCYLCKERLKNSQSRCLLIHETNYVK